MRPRLVSSRRINFSPHLPSLMNHAIDATQSILALLVHEYDLEIPAQLWRFMKDFDNYEEAKCIYFEQIKTGEYKF